MSNSLVKFCWEVPDEGHHWHDAGVVINGNPDPQLAERATPGLANRRRYDPFVKAPALFRVLARTPPTREGIVAFADEWGPLYGWEGLAEPGQPADRPAEMLSSWVRAISEMKHAVELWDVLRGGTNERRRDFLQQHLVREQDPDGSVTIYYDTHTDLLPRDRRDGDDGYERVCMAVASDRFGDEAPAAGRMELSRPARLFLCRLANRNLRRVSAQLSPDTDRVMKDLLPVMASIRMVPANLLAAMWLQFAYVMSSDKEQRLCPGCGEWFQLEKGKRSDKAYCTDTCRKKVYRERQERARQLHADGKSVREIAKALDADTKSVQRWLTRNKGTNTKG